MKLTIDSDVLAYAFIEPTKEVYKEKIIFKWNIYSRDTRKI